MEVTALAAAGAALIAAATPIAIAWVRYRSKVRAPVAPPLQIQPHPEPHAPILLTRESRRELLEQIERHVQALNEGHAETVRRDLETFKALLDARYQRDAQELSQHVGRWGVALQGQIEQARALATREREELSRSSPSHPAINIRVDGGGGSSAASSAAPASSKRRRA